jgi:hypothetical protein
VAEVGQAAGCDEADPSGPEDAKRRLVPGHARNLLAQRP